MFRKTFHYKDILTPVKKYFIVSFKQMSDGPTQAKKHCPIMKIGTHNGTFHCDEVLACFLLKQLPEYSDAEIIRTRDQGLLDTCDIVVDVGGVYDPTKHRYDHHQRSFGESMNTLNDKKKWITKLSSAGLVYCHFGMRIISKLIGAKSEDSITSIIYDKVYENFVEEIDAIDNGISVSDETPRYTISTTLSARVSHLNPRWNESGIEPDERFKTAMKLVGTEFKDRVDFYSQGWWPARELVAEAMNKRNEIDPSNEIMVLANGGYPWKDHLLDLEEELGVSPPIKFVLYTDQNNRWRVQCVPKEKNSFENRLPLLEEWRGIRDEELSKLSGIQGCIFVHASGFIGGNETYEGVLEMARRTLQGKPTAS